MPNIISAESAEAEVDETSGYFYQRLGELRFIPEGIHQSPEKHQGNCQHLAVASKHGLAVFADQQGIYIAKMQRLLRSATKGEEDQELPPVAVDEVCEVALPMAAASVALSPDETLLAAWDNQNINVWSLGALVNKRDTKPLTEWVLPSGESVKQVAWRPLLAPDAVPEAAVVTVKGKLLRGSPGGRLQPLPEIVAEEVSCVAWSADGSLLALASKNCITVQHVESGHHFRTGFDSQEAEDVEGIVIVDTLAWLGPQALFVSATLHPVEDVGAEMDVAPLALVRWSKWDLQAGEEPDGLQLVEFLAPPVNEHAAAPGSGSYSHIARIPAWGAVVVAHSKASDDHVRLYEVGPDNEAKAIDIIEDWSAIRIPTAMDYNDNYVTGLGMDLTSVDVKVNPPDPEASELPPSPVLLVSTSDGALRLFTLAHMTKPTEGVVAPALPLSDALPRMAGAEEQETAPTPPQQQPPAEELAMTAPLPSDEDSSSEEEVPLTAVPRRPRTATEKRAAAAALPPSSEERFDRSDVSSSESGPDGASLTSTSAAAARAIRATLPSDESDLEDDADSRVVLEASSNSHQHQTMSRLKLAEEEDEAESRTSLGPITGRKLDFDSEREGKAGMEKKMPPAVLLGQQPASAVTGLKQLVAPAFPWASAAAQSSSATTSTSAPPSVAPAGTPSMYGGALGSLPAFSAGTGSAFAFAKQAASSPGTASMPAFSSASALGAAAKPSTGLFGWPAFASSSAFGPASASSSQVSQAVPTLPPQSAAQKAITKARKEATLKAASTNTQEPSAAFPSQRPSEPAELQPSLGLAAVTDKKSSAKAMAGTAAQKRSDAADLGKGRAAPAQQSIQLEVKAKPAQLKPAEPVARLIGESKELAAMEADFLKTLAETRELQQAFSAAMASADGSAGSGPGTRLGSQAPLKMSEALKSSVAYLLASLISESRRFDELHKGWRDVRVRAEALLFFKRRSSNSSAANGSVDEADSLDPTLQDVATLIETQLHLLQKQTSQLNDCLKALGERTRMQLSGGVPRATTQQLYNAVNAQTSVATAQLERLEVLWEKLHEMGLSNTYVGKDSCSNQPPPFPGISAVTVSNLDLSSARTPNYSSRREWQQVRKSPLSRSAPRRIPALSPLGSSAGSAESPWSSDSANSLRRLLLEKVSMKGGGVRLTRVSGTVFPQLPTAAGQEECEWSSPTRGVVTSPQPSDTPPANPASLPSPFNFANLSAQVVSTAKAPALGLSFGESAGLTRSGSSAGALDRIQPQAAPLLQTQVKDAPLSAWQTSGPTAFQTQEANSLMRRRDSTASADSTGSTTNSALRPKHARPGSALEQFQAPPGKPRPAFGLSLARTGSTALGLVEPADSSESVAESTNKIAKTALKADPPVQVATTAGAAQPKPVAANMSPVSSRAASAAAQERAQGPTQMSAPSPAAKVPPVPSRAAVAAAQAQAQAALQKSAASQAAKMPPVPSKAALEEAQAQGQAALQKNAAARAGVPPVPTKEALAAAQAQGQAALQKSAVAPSAKMPPVPSKAAVAAAQAQAQAALQKSGAAKPGSQTAAAASIESVAAPPLSALTSPAPSNTPSPAFNFASFSFSNASSSSTAISQAASNPFGGDAQTAAAFSFASAMSMTSASSAEKAASPAAGPFASAQPSTSAAPDSFQIATSLAASQPSFGSSGMSAPPYSPTPSLFGATSTPGITAGSAPALSAGGEPASAAMPAALPSTPASTGISRFGQQAAAISSTPPSLFGSQAPASSSATLSFGAYASQQTASPAAFVTGFGAFGGLGQSAPLTASGGSPFGKGLSFGSAPSSTPTSSPFSGFGQPSSAAATSAGGFTGFAQTAPAFGQPQAPMSLAAPTSGPFSGGFAQTPQFGQPQLSGGFGQPAALGSAFGQPATPGFGLAGSPGFGKPAAPSFGAVATPGFGSPSTPAPHFGGSAFGSAATQGSSFGAFASQAGQPNPFGAAAQAGGGFATAAQQGGGFGSFGGGSGFGAFSGAASAPAAAPGNSDMWQMRK